MMREQQPGLNVFLSAIRTNTVQYLNRTSTIIIDLSESLVENATRLIRSASAGVPLWCEERHESIIDNWLRSLY
jgi:hypothetical protein